MIPCEYSLEELIDKCREITPFKPGYFQLMGVLRLDLMKNYCCNFLKHKTMKELFMMYYMKKTEGKIWIGETKGWVKK